MIINLGFLYKCKESPNSKIENGKILANTYCSSCHKFPQPDLLAKSHWKEYILPRMGEFMGIYRDLNREQLIQSNPKILGAIYPKESTISSKDWNDIQAYYLNEAPDSLIWSEPEARIQDNFEISIPKIKFSPPSSTYVNISEKGIINFADAHKGQFVLLDKTQSITQSANVGEGVVNIFEDEKTYYLTVMGSFSPQDLNLGYILSLEKENGKAIKILDKLNRPVHTSYQDFDNNGFLDLLVCEYGQWAGALNLYFSNGKTLKKKTMLNQTGPIKTQVVDYNDDGLLDFISLFGQGNEKIYLHTNKGNQNFDTSVLIDLSPSNGSSSFRLFDLDDDEDLDIIYTAGDNADFGPVLKPYHGIYLYKNDGKFNFTKSSFIPLSGAYDAIPSDFDNDGDLDIAAFSFFPDYKNKKNQSFIYLENKSGTYDRTYLPISELGRWLVMDTGDIDGDKDDDIILGSLAFEVPDNPKIVNFWSQKGIPFVILENKFQ